MTLLKNKGFKFVIRELNELTSWLKSLSLLVGKALVVCVVVLAYVVGSLVPDPENQEALVVENVPNPLAGEQQMSSIAFILPYNRHGVYFNFHLAAWIVDNFDEEELDCGIENDGMVLDEGEDGFSYQKHKYSKLDSDEASLRFGDFEEETVNDSMMMMSFIKKIPSYKCCH
ncbi:hypothetical protein VNO77_22863 [Canavalia gladiata]|uniref:Uncharacterized protein n=1 Tax=Canavalia gladiata TaxID=3824 RepID=A0AAN9QBD0_CANGL